MENTNPSPTGRIVRAEDGTYDMILTRTFEADAADVWASLTEPDRTALWFGRWRGEGGSGTKAEVQMSLEEGAPWFDMSIDECVPPQRLAITSSEAVGAWKLEVRLSENEGKTELEFFHHEVKPEEAGDIGPGWEFYLDALIASREGASVPEWTDYHPQQSPYYLEQAKTASEA